MFEKLVQFQTSTNVFRSKQKLLPNKFFITMDSYSTYSSNSNIRILMCKTDFGGYKCRHHIARFEFAEVFRLPEGFGKPY